MIMNTEQRLALMKNRLTTLKGSPKNIKCPGVVKKLERQIRNIQNKTELIQLNLLRLGGTKPRVIFQQSKEIDYKKHFEYIRQQMKNPKVTRLPASAS